MVLQKATQILKIKLRTKQDEKFQFSFCIFVLKCLLFLIYFVLLQVFLLVFQQLHGKFTT